MPNAATHSYFAAITVAVAHGIEEFYRTDTVSPKPVVSACAAAVFASLPDWVEPAANPNHRQFFHSVAFAVFVGAGMQRFYKWRPASPLQEAFRWFSLVPGGAYLAHLAIDATTPKSIPLIGRL